MEILINKVLAIETPGWQKEIIVVNDGSTDDTRNILKKFEHTTLVLHEKTNGGKGTAVHHGLERAQGDFVLLQDADLEYEPNDIPALLAGLEKADVVYGSRNLLPRERTGAYIPRIGVWFLTTLINLLYGLRLTDVWTCYKLFPRKAGVDFVAGRFESELLFTAALARQKYRFIEIPIAYHPRKTTEGKKIRYRDGMFAIFVILRDWLTHPSSAPRPQ